MSFWPFDILKLVFLIFFTSLLVDKQTFDKALTGSSFSHSHSGQIKPFNLGGGEDTVVNADIV